MPTVAYPFFAPPMIGSVAGSKQGQANRKIGQESAPTSPFNAETYLPFGGLWGNVKYQLIQENSQGSFFLQRQVDGGIVGDSITVLQESQFSVFFDNDTVSIFKSEGLAQRWQDTNLAGAFDPIVIAGSTWFFNNDSFGFGD